MAAKKQSKSLPQGPVTDIHEEYGLFGPYLLTKRGSLIGAVEFDGRDPDGLSRLNFEQFTWIARNTYQQYGDDITISQYFAHFDGAKVKLKTRAPGIAATLSKRREVFLNKKKLTETRLVHFFEMAPSEALSSLKPSELIKHLAMALTSAQSREALKVAFGSTKAVVVKLEELERQHQRLTQVLSETVDKWEGLIGPRTMSTQEIWAFCRFVSNLEPSYLTTALNESVPGEGWDATLTDSDIAPVSIQNMDALAFRSATTRYARVLSVNEFSGKDIQGGLWAANLSAPIRQNKNFIILSRFAPLTRLQKSLLFSEKQKEISRRNFSVAAAMKGQTADDVQKGNKALQDQIQKRLGELTEAEDVEDVWGMAQASMVCWDSNPARLRETCSALKSSANKSNMSICWESAGLPRAWQAFLPAGQKHSFRNIPFTATQFAAASLLYRSSVGQPVIKDMDNEEAQYVFQKHDGTVFHYSPNVNGRSVTFGIGPIGSGKTFTKNSTASHFLKYSGVDIHGNTRPAIYRAIDIDPGTETLAQVFGENGHIFRIDHTDGKTMKGFNPFASCRADNDDQFASHLRRQIMLMMSYNDNPSMQLPTAEEQRGLDFAIAATMKMPPHMRRLGTLLGHCSADFRMKLARWFNDPVTRTKGPYAFLMDQEVDSLGDLTAPVGVYNLAGVKDDPIALPIVMNELWYRTKRMIEDESIRSVPKMLDVDEAHVILGIPRFAQESDTFIRTCRKWTAGISFWSQSPREFFRLDSWSALRSAASTFKFMADPKMNPQEYMDAFLLTPGECEAIRNLVPKREAYIVQRDIGVSTRVILEVEPEQYIVNTSQGREASLRAKNIKEYGFEVGLQKTMEALGLQPTVAVDDTHDVEPSNSTTAIPSTLANEVA